MPLLSDPDALERLAGVLHGHADELRSRADRIVIAADTARWQSLAAERFRAEVGGVARDLRRVAGRVDDGGDAMRRHARVVREVQAVVLAGVAVTGAALDTAAEGAELAVGGAAHAARHAGGAVLHAMGLSR